MINKSLGCILESGLEGGREGIGRQETCIIQTKLMNVCLGKIRNELRNYEIKIVFALTFFFQPFFLWMKQVYDSHLQRVCKYITCGGPRQCMGNTTNTS